MNGDSSSRMSFTSYVGLGPTDTSYLEVRSRAGKLNFLAGHIAVFGYSRRRSVRYGTLYSDVAVVDRMLELSRLCL